MKLYWNYLTMELKSQMQYKMSFFLTLFGQFLSAFTAFFGIQFIFSRIYAVDDFTYGQVLICFASVMMSFSIGELAGGGFAFFDRLLGDGSFDRILVRPRSILLQIVVPNMDFSRLGLLLQAVIVLWIAVPLSQITWTWDKILVLCMMILSGSILFFCLFLLTASFAFFTLRSMDILNILTYGMQQFGRYPFSIYGSGILRFLTFVIPLALVQYYPLLYLLGQNSSILYMLSPLLALLFVIPTRIIFRIGLENYKSTGS